MLARPLRLRLVPRLCSSITRSLSKSASEPKSTVTKTASPAAQAPNYPTTWSTNQRLRPTPADSPCFEQTDMEMQALPLSAMGLIANEPVRSVNGRIAVCDGGDGPLGHPKIYINLDQPGPRVCGYCGLRFQQTHQHH